MNREKQSEQWSDLCRGTRKVAQDLGQAAWTGAWRAGQAAGSAVRCARLRLRALELQGALRGQMRRIGELVYATHTGTPTPSDTLQAALEEADRLHEALDECQRALAEARGCAVCGLCGAENPRDSTHCARCGQPLRP